MKWAAAISSIVFSLSVAASELDGIWRVVGRTCSDGQPVRDTFNLGADKMELKINGNTVEFTMQVACSTTVRGRCLYQPGGLVRHGILNEDMLVFPDDKVTYRFNKATQQLVIQTATGGACQPGQTLSTVFARNY